MLAALPTLALYWLDGSGSIGTTRITIGSHVPVATIDAAAASFAAAASALTGCVLVRQEITYRFVPATAMMGEIGSDKFNCGVFVFDAADAGEMGLIQVPAFKAEYLMSDGPGTGVLINVADTIVADFINLAISGVYCNPFAVALEEINRAYRQSRV